MPDDSIQNDPCRNERGVIFDIQRFSLDNGPGIRTTVFLKGCSMRCIWCHNPESQSADVQTAFYLSKCLHCGCCSLACAEHAISLDTDGRIDRSKCRSCGKCVSVCPAGALVTIGWIETVSRIVQVVRRDLPFYGNSGGGVTLSGGEPTYQHDFSLCLLRAFKADGLHTAVQTNGLTSRSRLTELLGVVDMFLFDLKAIDARRHQTLCGGDNAVILDNAKYLADTGANVNFRTPIVPGYNDSDDDMRQLCDFVLSLPGHQALELIPYHGTGIGKYRALAKECFVSVPDAPQSLERCQQMLRLKGIGSVEE